MKPLKKFIIVLVLFLVFSFAVFNNLDVNADDVSVYLLNANPAENANNSMNISWHSDTDTEKYVEYTEATDVDFKNSTKQTGSCELETIYDSSSGGDVTSYKFKATLIALKENTEYIYRIVGKGKSSVKSFKTGGASKYSAYIVSDVHTYANISSRLSKSVDVYNNIKDKAFDTQLVIATGDMTAYGTSRKDWKALLDSKYVSENVYAGTPGNHDYYNTKAEFLDGTYFGSNFNYPNNGAEGCINTTYYFYYGSVLYISLNSEAACTNSTLRQNQRVWLEKVLEENPSQFVVVYFHRSMYPGSGGNTGHATTMKNAYQDLFDKYGVDLVFGGHDHVYVRTNSIYNGTSSQISGVGTTYISLPQIGDRVNTANSNMTDIAAKVGSVSGGVLLSVDSENGNLMAYFYNDKNELLDSAGVVSKSKSLNMERYIKTSVKFSYDEKFSTLALEYGEKLFQRAYKISVFEKDGETEKLVASERPLYGDTKLDNLNVLDTDINKNYIVRIYMRDGVIHEKEYNVKNKEMDYGTIENLRYENGYVKWDADLNDIVSKYVLTINGEEYEVETSKKMYSVKLKDYIINDIKLEAFNDSGVCLYSNEIAYGEKKEVEYTYDNNVEIAVGEEKEFVFKNSLNEKLNFIFTSSDDVVIDGLKVKSNKAGSYTLNVECVETKDKFEISLNVYSLYTVKFVVDGEETLQAVKEGEKAKKPIDPEKVGYTFVGWYVGDAEYAFDAVKADVAVTAKFEAKEYIVTFVTDVKEEVKVKYGEKVNKPADPEKVGYVFKGWYIGENEYLFIEVTEDVTVTAKFEIKEHTVTFVTDGKEEKVTVKHGEKANKPADPVKNGYVFTGWYEGENEYSFSEVIEDITVTAKFEAKKTGCGNTMMILMWSLTLLGICIIRKKIN